MPNLHAVIMAGGSGTRFWPASRKDRPKQFLPLASGRPLIEAAVARVRGLCPPERIWIVTNPTQAAALPAVLPDFPADQIVVEPEARDTAPCVALAVATVEAQDPAALMAVMPADHVIRPDEEFQRMLQRGAAIATDDRTLVTFGVVPTYPATGYGYIECGTALDRDDEAAAAFHATRFREKPDRATAEQFVRAGNFLWNSGIFVWSIPAVRAAMAAGSPHLLRSTDGMLAGLQRGDTAAVHSAFRGAPKTSIDFAVMEHAPQIAVVRATVRWDDVGSFPALSAVGDTDAACNTSVLGRGAQQIALDSRDNVVYAEGDRTVALFGVEGLVVVAVDDAVMVCPKDRADDLKKLVEQLQARGRSDLL